MRAWTAVGGLVLVLGTATACGDDGAFTVMNNGPAEVTVSAGDQEFTLPPSEGNSVLDYGCTPGDVTVTFSSGTTVVLPGPVCPDQQVVVGDGTAELQPT